MSLGEKLRDARANRQLTQEEVADRVGIPRTSLIQIEGDTRSVTTNELRVLAKLYETSLVSLLTEPDEERTLVAQFRARRELADLPETRQEIERHLEIFQDGAELEKLLGDRVRAPAPAYVVPDPRTYAEALKQGEAIAVEERRRLNLGSRPIVDMAEVLSGQGIWAAASSLPDHVSGMFLHHPSIGIAVIINEGHQRSRRRFSYAHEYAHALADRDRAAVSATSTTNARELVERRANAFAGEFLVPRAGAAEVLDRFDKGGASREYMGMWDVASARGETVEKRNEPGSQTIGYQDVAYLAYEFTVSYDVAAYRLSDMGKIDRRHLEMLLGMRSQANALARVLRLCRDDDEEKVKEEQPRLKQQIGLLAIEAYRRGAIASDRLLDICTRLGIVETSELLALAGAVRSGEENSQGPSPGTRMIQRHRRDRQTS